MLSPHHLYRPKGESLKLVTLGTGFPAPLILGNSDRGFVLSVYNALPRSQLFFQSAAGLK